MMPTQHQPLTVYKASAGSGKTFTLALEYIKLLIDDPQNYRYILAVTFTNKATEEMKKRILARLYSLSKGLKEKEDFLSLLLKHYPKLTENDIRERAEAALQNILHHYHYFKVVTIDSFFQTVLRNLARELGLPANLQVGLNDKEIENKAVDNIIEQINTDNDPLLTWIMDFVREKMNEDKTWNVISQIKDFGQNIFKDFYKDNQKQLERIMNDPSFFKNYTSELTKMKAEAIKAMKAYGQAFEDLKHKNGWENKDFFQGEKGVPSYFRQLLQDGAIAKDKPNTYVANALEDRNCLLSKAKQNDPSFDHLKNSVWELLTKAEKERKEKTITINSVTLTLKNLNELRLLGRIEKEVNKINAQNGNFLLSNTQKLLNTLINEQDSPFIYEKIGGQLRYIMIDEFQDTSITQWNNFKILLEDCIAHNNGSLIVGDVKQSIYRWRNGDWRLLKDLTPENDSRIRLQELNTNYRSKRRIVEFNNAFFRIASTITRNKQLIELHELHKTGALDEDCQNLLLKEASEIKKAYADVKQNVTDNALNKSDKEAGAVEITLLPTKGYDTLVIEKVRQIIEELLSAGTQPKDIAILVRDNKKIQEIANYFQQNEIIINNTPQYVNMVSDEAFILQASRAVRILVKAMYVLSHEEDRLAMADLVKAYQSTISGNDNLKDSELYIGIEDLKSKLPIQMIAEWDTLRTMSIIDLAENLFRIFDLEKYQEQSAYVCAFFDQLADFTHRHLEGVEEFLVEWDENLCNKAIHSDEIDGIRLLTIHKSKGLEYENVIIPYCDWATERSTDILWVSPQQSPYNKLPIVPINIQKNNIIQSIYNPDYQSENIKNLVDNLNLMYVAFTRAEANLFIIGKADKPKFPSLLLNDVLHHKGYDIDYSNDYSKNAEDESETASFAQLLSPFELEETEDGVKEFRFGTRYIPQIQSLSVENRADGHTAEKPNVFLTHPEPIQVNIQNHEVKALFKQSNDSKYFIQNEEQQEEQAHIRSYIETGNILHRLFASIKDVNDIDKAIDQLEYDGILYDKPMSREELTKMITSKLSNPQVAEWFKSGWKVYNECNILHQNPETGKTEQSRPDRVIHNDQQMIVIDFKTGKESDTHEAQVRRYIQLLEQMGHRNVSGYLWYIRTNQVKPVTKI